MMFVMTYGTLKKGEPNHNWMTEPGKGAQRYIGRVETVEKYPLVIASRYNIPFLLDIPGRGHNIRGELYEIDEEKLAHLDILEDYPKLYTRRKEKIRILDPDRSEEELEAVVYFIKTYKKEMLDLEFMSEYSSYGDHGKPYCSCDDDLSDPEDI